jgi:hypothetical protein
MECWSIGIIELCNKSSEELLWIVTLSNFVDNFRFLNRFKNNTLGVDTMTAQ